MPSAVASHILVPTEEQAIDLKQQIADGADPKKVRVVPNGIDLDRFGEAARVHDTRPPNKRFTVCFLGRVCPIKDVITFINAIRLVADKVSNVHCRVLGPMDEDPEYADMCKRQVELLGLQDNVFFEGKVDVLEELPKVDVMVLTSLSEAQPLVILEAGAIGIPSIATDVGSCSELLFGRGPEDRALGAGGLITPMASPGETARAILELHDNPSLRERMRDSMRARVEQFYDQRDMVASYDEIYTRYKHADDRLPDPEERSPEPESAQTTPSEPEPAPELPVELPVQKPDPGLLQPPDVDPVTVTAQPGITTLTTPDPQPSDVDPVTKTAGSGDLSKTTPGSEARPPDVDPVTDTQEPGDTLTRLDPDATGTRVADDTESVARGETKTELND